LAVTDALIKHLKQNNMPFTIRPDEDNRTRHLFIVHPEFLKLAQENPDIVITDCTYQTNKFNLPLLYMVGMSDFSVLFGSFLVFSKAFLCFRIGELIIFVGITSSAKIFSIEFTFLPNESTESYIFAFQEFKKISIRPPVMVMDGSDRLKSAAAKVYTNMPMLLCTWHVNKNMFSKCKGNFQSKEEWEIFYGVWRDLIQLPTFEIFNERW
jgi:hypothetical protein